MISSQNNIVLGLSEIPRTAFNTNGIALLLNEKRGGSLSKKLNYYVQKGLLANSFVYFYLYLQYAEDIYSIEKHT